jgi:hypothetical protein
MTLLKKVQKVQNVQKVETKCPCTCLANHVSQGLDWVTFRFQLALI